MKIPPILVSLSLAFLTTLALYYLFNPQTTLDLNHVKAGQEFQALQSKAMLQPINVEVDFLDSSLVGTPKKTNVETPLALYEFSSGGASIDQLTFKRTINGTQELITTIAPLASHEREKTAFLIALESLTPYGYELIEQKQEQGKFLITYQLDNDSALITKQYIIYDATYKIDLLVTVEPKNKMSIQPRLFVPGPLFTTPGHSPDIKALVYTDSNSLKKIKLSDVASNSVWAAPSLFGIENRYFIHALVADTNHFVQRAYYKTNGADLTAILEGPAISEKTTWLLSFYCGPKEATAMDAVDSRLESTLEYGWLGPISRLLLFMLKTLYGYVRNYGLAIIILTLVISLALMPFSAQSAEQLQRQAELLKKRQYIEQKYRHDQERLEFERQELLKKQEASGSEIMGCLPLLIQAPLFIAFNSVLANSIELYHAPFLWIHDLSLPDPYYIIPGLMALGMFLRIQNNSKDARQSVAAILIALLIGGIAARFAAGLALYTLVTTLTGVLQPKMREFTKKWIRK